MMAEKNPEKWRENSKIYKNGGKIQKSLKMAGKFKKLKNSKDKKLL